jgi:hypothetical protein
LLVVFGKDNQKKFRGKKAKVHKKNGAGDLRPLHFDEW